MTQEEKSLLLQDLCARLPHGVICQTDEHGKNYKLKGINKHKGIWWYEFDGFRTIKLPKPYLRPMSSMTEEERNEYEHIAPGIVIEDGIRLPNINQINWLNAHHFDYFGLIEKGLAIEAPEGMYKN